MTRPHILRISLILLSLFQTPHLAHAATMAFSISYSPTAYSGYYGVFHSYTGHNPFYPSVRFPGPTPSQYFRDYLRLKGVVEQKMATFYAARQDELNRLRVDKLNDPVPQEFYDRIKEEEEKAKEIKIDVVPDLEESSENDGAKESADD